MEQPKVIFLDAVGTLFGIRGSVGEVYSAIAQRYGVRVPAPALNEAFREAFAAADPSIFPGADPEEIAQREFEWWWFIASRTFQHVGVLDQFADFTNFFDELYKHFATADPWFVYPDVLPALRTWRRVGIELGVISNFDSRLHSVLNVLELEEFFHSVTISTHTGFAKPEPQIFTAALQKHDCNPRQAWHIGDSLTDDCKAAAAAGLRGIWLERLPTSSE